MAEINSEAAARVALTKIFRVAIAACDPARLTNLALDGKIPGTEELPALIQAARRIVVLAAGKGAAAMASAIEARLDRRISDAIAVIPPSDPSVQLSRVDVLRGDHPVPALRSCHAAEAALDLMTGLDADTLAIVAVSGGASAMLCAPAAGITLDDKIAITTALLASGAPIAEFNAVRKHLSRIKGGQLARSAVPARVFGLVISDVIGNDLATIGSGLTTPDPTTYAEAISILKRRRIWGRAPERVRAHLEGGAAGEIPETPKRDAPAFARVTNAIIGDNATALDAAAEAASKMGFTVERWSALRGEADDVGREVAAHLAAIQRERVCVLAGGEPVVTLRGKGKGGRAQQCALKIAIELERLAADRRIAALVAGTDGIDGPTDAAGGFAFPDGPERSAASGVDARAALKRNDAYNGLAASGDLFRIGPTGTNVSDLLIAFVNY